jgi:hypothetical protein
MDSPIVSPYLRLPLRTRDQVLEARIRIHGREPALAGRAAAAPAAVCLAKDGRG